MMKKETKFKVNFPEFCHAHRRAELVLLLLGSLAFLFPLSGFAARPTLTVARCEAPPLIDGTFNSTEWKSAAIVCDFQSEAGTLDEKTTAYLMADDHTLYVAIRCTEPNAAGPRGFAREHDDRVFDDDAVQIYIAPEDLRKAKDVTMTFGGYEGSFDNWYTDIKAYYEFSVNCLGSTTEAWNDVRDWNAPWLAKTGKEAGAWIVEMAIPLASIGISELPNDTLWGLNIIRNRQTKLSGWAGCSFGGYTPLPLGAIWLTRNQVVAQQQPITKPQPGANSMEVVVANNTKQPADVDLTLTSPGGKASVHTVKIPAMEQKSIRGDYEVAGEGSLMTQYKVSLIGQAAPLLSGQVGCVIPEKQELWVRYFSNTEQVYGDVKISPDSRAARAVLTLKSATGEPVRSEEVLTGKKGATLKVPVQGQPGDKFDAKLQVFSAKGLPIAEEKLEVVIPPKYAWEGTKAGLPLGVLPPWTPIAVEGSTVRMLGKELQYTDSAFPTKVITTGKEILSAPIRLTVKSGKSEVLWPTKEFKVLEQDEQHVKVESLWRGERFDLRVTSNVEYDGFSWNEATLIPHGSQEVEGVSLEIPLNKETSKYACLGTSQNGFEISPVGYRGPFPHTNTAWVGNEERGMSWMVEGSDWIKSKDTGNQVEMIPGPSGTLWRLNFIDTPTVLDKPYDMQFALHVTPSKPISLKKLRIYHPMAEWDLATARALSTVTIPAKGNIDPNQGTVEFWVKPTFDTQEKPEPGKDLSSLHRQVFTMGSERETCIVYYNAVNRNFVAVITDASKANPAIVAGAGPLPANEWSYVALSWGDKLRLRVNDTVSEQDYKGMLLPGGPTLATLLVSDFNVSDFRISTVARSLDIPTAAPVADAQTSFLLNKDDPLKAEKRLGDNLVVADCTTLSGKFGQAVGQKPGRLRLDGLAADSMMKVVTFHENWSLTQNYPDLSRAPELKAIADAVHERGMRFTLYFNQMISEKAPEWKEMKSDSDIYYTWGKETMQYHRDYDVKQDCYTSCVNGPFGELLLDGIAKLADQVGIDGVYMDGTTVAWPCANPSHPGCGVPNGDGTYESHMPIREVRQFQKRLRNIFVQRGKDVFMDAHTGNGVNTATLSFCDGYLDGESLARFKKGYRLSLGDFVPGFLGKNIGYRGEVLLGKLSIDEGLAISLVHDVETRGQPAPVTRALSEYEDTATQFVPYWDHSDLYSTGSKEVLGSVYLKADKALLVMGSQAAETVESRVDVANLLKKLPKDVSAYDVINGEKIELTDNGFNLNLPGQQWRMIEFLKK